MRYWKLAGFRRKSRIEYLSSARETTKSIDIETLHKEKGTLINEANRLFGKGNLFATPVENFMGVSHRTVTS